MKDTDKIVCDCGWSGMRSQVLTGANPFDARSRITACPSCKQLKGTLQRGCDAPQCKSYCVIGKPTPLGYKHLCAKHENVFQ